MLQLLLEIPNPGGRGRRLVTSTAGPGSATHAHTHARTGAEGPDFLAVEWPAIQRLEGQAIRDDADRVMLIGVDTSRLPSGERDRIRDALTELRPEISRILASIDWDMAGHETVIESAALVDLLRGPVFLNLPTHAQVSPSRETGTAATERPSAGALLRLLALAVGFHRRRHPPRQMSLLRRQPRRCDAPSRICDLGSTPPRESRQTPR